MMSYWGEVGTRPHLAGRSPTRHRHCRSRSSSGRRSTGITASPAHVAHHAVRLSRVRLLSIVLVGRCPAGRVDHGADGRHRQALDGVVRCRHCNGRVAACADPAVGVGRQRAQPHRAPRQRPAGLIGRAFVRCRRPRRCRWPDLVHQPRAADRARLRRRRVGRLARSKVSTFERTAAERRPVGRDQRAPPGRFADNRSLGVARQRRTAHDGVVSGQPDGERCCLRASC